MSLKYEPSSESLHISSTRNPTPGLDRHAVDFHGEDRAGGRRQARGNFRSIISQILTVCTRKGVNSRCITYITPCRGELGSVWRLGRKLRTGGRLPRGNFRLIALQMLTVCTRNGVYNRCKVYITTCRGDLGSVWRLGVEITNGGAPSQRQFPLDHFTNARGLY